MIAISGSLRVAALASLAARQRRDPDRLSRIRAWRAGSFKNALDWVVGMTGLEGKPAALAEIVPTMGWSIVEAACVRIPCARRDVAPEALAGMPEFTQPLRAALPALAEAAQHHVAGRFHAS